MVDTAFDRGELVVGWLNRGTLHMVASEDYRWLHDLTAGRQRTSNRTRLGQEGVSEVQAQRAAGLIARRLEDGPETRNALREMLESADIPVAGQAFVHILMFASLEGVILRGPMLGGEQGFVLADDWLPRAEPPEEEVALAELARRYLRSHGPAGDADLANWAGMSLGRARRGLRAIGEGLRESGGKAHDNWPPPRLLGPFDPVLHGWKSRDWLLPEERSRRVVTVNGIFRATMLVRGEVVGVWTMPGGKVELDPFAPLDRDAEAAFQIEAGRVEEYLKR